MYLCVCVYVYDVCCAINKTASAKQKYLFGIQHFQIWILDLRSTTVRKTVQYFRMSKWEKFQQQINSIIKLYFALRNKKNKKFGTEEKRNEKKLNKYVFNLHHGFGCFGFLSFCAFKPIIFIKRIYGLAPDYDTTRQSTFTSKWTAAAEQLYSFILKNENEAMLLFLHHPHSNPIANNLLIHSQFFVVECVCVCVCTNI